MIDVTQQLFTCYWNETTNIWRNFRLFHNVMYKRSRSKDWRTNNAPAPRFYETRDNILRLYACPVKDEQYLRSTLEVKDEQIRLSLDAWGQGLTDEQHSRYSLEAECGREMASNATWTETSNPDIDTLDLDRSALLLCVSFTCSKVQITRDAREKIAFFAFHTFLVVDSLFEKNRVRAELHTCPHAFVKATLRLGLRAPLVARNYYYHYYYYAEKSHSNCEKSKLRDTIPWRGSEWGYFDSTKHLFFDWITLNS